MEWYYATNGQQNGPVSQEQLLELLQSGQVKSSDLVWNDTMTDWVPAKTVPELSVPKPEPEAAPESTSSETVDSGSAPPADPYSSPPAESATEQPSLSPVVNQTTLPSGQTVPTYLWQSIVCLVLCCLPAAIPALIFSTKVEPALKRGDYAAAKEASDKAKMWCWIAFGVGLVANIAIFALSFLGAIMEEM